MAGALDGITVIELAAIGPVPFAAMMLADHGARVIMVERPNAPLLAAPGTREVINRNREFVTCDLKTEAGRAQLIDLIDNADVLLEGFRPGVLERMGLAPDDLLARNPRLVIGRMTGWGQDGPRAQRAGHDLNYIALSGILSTFGRAGTKPAFPLNLVGDYGGGGMLLAFGVLAGVLSARATGKGQVVDAAMVDGTALLSTLFISMAQLGYWTDQREDNLLDGGAPFYDVYETSDGKWISIGSIEPQFYAQLLDLLGLTGDPDFAGQMDRSAWPRAKARLDTIFRTRTRDEWCALFDETDVCFAPVLSLSEAPHDQHIRARGTLIDVEGLLQPAPAPRFSGTPAPPIRLPKTR
jgi:alpha-methylacyl-CoA racemase